MPKELPADSPRADLLTLKTLWGRRHHPPAEWLHTAEVRDVVAREWRALQPLCAWLDRHVGVSR